MRRWWFVPFVVLLVVLFFRARPAGYSSIPSDSAESPPGTNAPGTVVSLEPTASAVPTAQVVEATLPIADTVYPALGTEQPSPTFVPTPTIAAPTPTHEPPVLEPEIAPPTPQSEPTAAPGDVPASANDDHSPVRLQIPTIGLDLQPVSVGIDENRVPIVPKHDAGWFNMSALPGTGSNIVFWGHVLRWRDSPDIAAPFARLHELEPGAPVEITLADGQHYTYRVTQQLQVKPEQVEYILPTTSERVTLVSCIGDKVIREGVLTKEFRLITIAEPE